METRGDDVSWDTLSVGATRPATIRSLNVPFLFILPIVGVPVVFVTLTGNPLWLGLMLPLTAVGRLMVARDHNRPRVLALAITSGAMFGDRAQWGGITTDPLGTRSHAG